MKIIYGAIKENGKVRRKVIVLEDRECDVCREIFIPKKQISKYCSLKCSKKGDYEKHREQNKEKRKEYYLNNKERLRKQRKKYYADNREKALEYSKQWRIDNREKSKKTNTIHHDKLRYDGLRELVLQRDAFKCQKCGAAENILVHHKDRNTRNNTFENLVTFCRACHLSEHREDIKKYELSECKICGQEFFSYRKTNILCSDVLCKKKHKAEQKRSRQKHDDVVCLICGKVFTQKHNTHKTCSVKCRKIYDIDQKHKRYENNKQQYLDRQKRYYAKNTEKVKSYVKKWQQENPDLVRAYHQKTT